MFRLSVVFWVEGVGFMVFRPLELAGLCMHVAQQRDYVCCTCCIDQSG